MTAWLSYGPPGRSRTPTAAAHAHADASWSCVVAAEVDEGPAVFVAPGDAWRQLIMAVFFAAKFTQLSSSVTMRAQTDLAYP
jgi:hypothetical protein